MIIDNWKKVNDGSVCEYNGMRLKETKIRLKKKSTISVDAMFHSKLILFSLNVEVGRIKGFSFGKRNFECFLFSPYLSLKLFPKIFYNHFQRFHN